MKHIVWMMALSGTLLMAESSKLDAKTGLIWQDNPDVSAKSLNFDEAVKYCQELELDGFTDWRLPTLKEAYTIVDMTRNRPALKNGFDIPEDSRFWTSTLFAKDPEKEAWYISMSYGEANPYKKGRMYHVRCVRK